MKKNNDLRKILTKEHEDKWAALSEDYNKVVDFSPNLLDLKKKIGAKKVVYMKTPKANTYFAF